MLHQTSTLSIAFYVFILYRFALFRLVWLTYMQNVLSDEC